MEEKKKWVDFSAVKAAVSMQMVLEHYGINLRGCKKNANELRGLCPIHESEAKHSLTVNTSKNIFKCWSRSCKARGNVLDFVAAMENCSIRDAAVKLAEWFNVGDNEQQAAAQSEGTLTRLHKLITELEGHLEQSANHLAQAEEKRAAIRMLVVELDKGG